MKRILVIEDAPDVSRIICDTIEAHGWQPISAQDGEQGVALAKNQSPDLVLCDIRMPRRDGYSVLRELRAWPGTANIPFIFLSGLGEKLDVRQGMELGADDYIVKPFTPRELGAAVESRLRKQAAMIEAADQKLAELRSTLNSALPHELVTPLNSILGFSSLIMDTPDITTKDAREYAGHILEAGERLRRLIDAFIFYAQLEVAAADPDRVASFQSAEPIPTRERITLGAMRAAEQAHRTPDLALELVTAPARIAQIHLDRVARELVENAFKFSSPGDAVRVVTRVDGAGLELIVSNQGAGFSPEHIAQLGAHLQFKRDQQEQQGTGLGLAIVKRLSALYGGAFWIESSPGELTSAHVRLRS